MCREMFRDLEVPWVQDYMLRSRPRQDAFALTDPANYSRAVSSVFRGAAMPGVADGFTASLEVARLVLPVASIDHIGVGLGVDKTSVKGALGVAYPTEDKFFRCVTNNRHHSFLYIVDHEDFGTVSAPYYGYRKDGLWVCGVGTFNRAGFFESFNKKSKKIDFEKMNQHLIHSIVAGVKHDQRPTIITNHLYPDKLVDNVGDHVAQTALTSHANGHAMMTLTDNNNGRWYFNHDPAALREMLNWGINERLQQIRVSPALDVVMASDCSIMNEQVHEKTARRKTGNSSPTLQIE